MQIISIYKKKKRISEKQKKNRNSLSHTRMYFYCNMLEEEEGLKILQICILGTMKSRCTIDISKQKLPYL